MVAAKKTEGEAPKVLGGRFAEYRGRSTAGRKKRGDFVLGAEEGFDPPIVIKTPDLIHRRALFYAQRNNDPFAMVEAAFGVAQYNRIINALNDDDAADELLAELGKDVVQHFFGEGAGEVPGGS